MFAITMKTTAAFFAFAVFSCAVSHGFVIINPRHMHDVNQVGQYQTHTGVVIVPSSPSQKTPTTLFFFNFGGGGDDPDRFVKDLFHVDNMSSDTTKYDSLVQYIKEWSNLLQTPGTGLTTPIKVEQMDDGVQITFVPKRATGKKYKSSHEEKELEKANRESKIGKESQGAGEREITATKVTTGNEPQEEGGIQIFVRNDKSLSVHAKRFNYGEEAAVKEMSESTIVSNLKEALTLWKIEQG